MVNILCFGANGLLQINQLPVITMLTCDVSLRASSECELVLKLII